MALNAGRVAFHALLAGRLGDFLALFVFVHRFERRGVFSALPNFGFAAVAFSAHFGPLVKGFGAGFLRETEHCRRNCEGCY